MDISGITLEDDDIEYYIEHLPFLSLVTEDVNIYTANFV